MIVLAIDTAGANGSVALCECGAGALARDCQILELVPLAGRTYSAQLMPQISALLARHKLDKRAIDAYAAATGPGSFTGLRVGLSTIKALAEITHKPIAAVSVLEALAWAGARGAARLSEPGTVEELPRTEQAATNRETDNGAHGEECVAWYIRGRRTTGREGTHLQLFFSEESLLKTFNPRRCLNQSIY